MLQPPANRPRSTDDEYRTGCVVGAVGGYDHTDRERCSADRTHQRPAKIVGLELPGLGQSSRRRLDQLLQIEVAEPADGADHRTIRAANNVGAPPARLEPQCLARATLRRVC